MLKFAYTTIALVTGSLVLPGDHRAQAQALSAPQMRTDLTMRDLENDAAQRTLSRAPSSADAAIGPGGTGNLFHVLQEGDYNTVDAKQAGTNNIIRVVQMGQMNTAIISQSGFGNSVTLRQGR